MKTTVILVFVTAVSVAFSAPTLRENEYRNARDMLLPHSLFNDSKLDSFFSDSKFYTFGQIFEELENIRRRLEQNMDENFKKLISTNDSQFELTEFDPTKVQNKTLHDTTVVDGKVIETDEQVFSSGTPQNGSIFRIKTVKVRPTEKFLGDSTSSSVQPPSTETTPNKIFSLEEEYAQEFENKQENEKKKSFLGNAESEFNNGLFHDDSGIGIGTRSTVINLHGDTRVNDRIFEEQRVSGLRVSEPDAELIDINSVNNLKGNSDGQKYFYSIK